MLLEVQSRAYNVSWFIREKNESFIIRLHQMSWQLYNFGWKDWESENSPLEIWKSKKGKKGKKDKEPEKAPAVKRDTVFWQWRFSVIIRDDGEEDLKFIVGGW